MDDEATWSDVWGEVLSHSDFDNLIVKDNQDKQLSRRAILEKQGVDIFYSFYILVQK